MRTYEFKNLTKKPKKYMEEYKIVTPEGCVGYFKNGLFHRDNDLPAYIYKNIKIYYINGKKHRENDLPAYIKNSNFKAYYKHGLRHRDNGPAVVDYKFGSEEYWVNNKLHRKDGPAIIERYYSKFFLDGIEYGTRQEFPTDEDWIRFVKLNIFA